MCGLCITDCLLKMSIRRSLLFKLEVTGVKGALHSQGVEMCCCPTQWDPRGQPGPGRSTGKRESFGVNFSFQMWVDVVWSVSVFFNPVEMSFRTGIACLH